MLWSRICFWIGCGFLFILLALYFVHPVADLVGDLGFYLRTGEIIAATHTIPTTNLFSYTNPTFPFINPNWLSEAVLYCIYTLSGFNGLIFFSLILITLALIPLLVYTCRKYNPFVVLCLTLLALQVLFERTDVKPELISYVFLSLYIFLLYSYRERPTRRIYALIPLMLLWVNMHIYFFTGFIVLAAFIIETIARQKQTAKNISKHLYYTFGGTFLAALCNPHFIQGVLYPFAVQQNYAFPVEENIPFFTAINSYTDTTFLPFFILVCILWTGMFLASKKMQIADWILAVIFTLAGFYAVRAFPLFILATFLPTAKAISYAFGKLYKKISHQNLLYWQTIIFIVLLAVLSPVIIQNISIHPPGLGVHDEAGAAINFLQQNHIHGPVYNNYDIGNYLIYSLPEEKVFVDGRPEAYPKSFFEQIYNPLQQNPEAFKQVAQKYHFNVLIIRHTDTSPGNISHLVYLQKNTDWKLVFLNNEMLLYLHNTPENASFINAHHITQDNVRFAASDLDDKQHVRQLVNIFRVLGWEKPWLQMNLKYLEYEPDNCSALQNAAYLYQKQNNPQYGIYLNRYTQKCST